MKNGSTLRVSLDVHKDSIAVASASEDGNTASVHRSIGLRLGAALDLQDESLLPFSPS